MEFRSPAGRPFDVDGDVDDVLDFTATETEIPAETTIDETGSLRERPRGYERRELTEEAWSQLGPLRAALAAYNATRQHIYLDRAFGAARLLVAGITGARDPAGDAPVALLPAESAGAAGGRDTAIPPARPDLEELRWLAQVIPEFAALLTTAAIEAERVLANGLAELWVALELASPVPRWIPSEVEAGRMLFACALAAAPGMGSDGRLPMGLRGISAGRVAGLIATDLARDEGLWRRALGDRYESVRHRYARRTTFRSRGLTDLLRADPDSQRAVVARLERWLTGGAALAELAPQLEAALVHERTPSRLA